MSTKVKFEGRWVEMSWLIKYKASKTTPLPEKTPVVNSTPIPVEEEVVSTVTSVIEEKEEESEVSIPEVSVESLREEYMNLSGKGISPKVRNNREWLQENINKLKNN